jgi:dTDP-4-dehydrorhamnose reductase
MRVLILGGSGMLGHKLAQILGRDFETMVTLRGRAAEWPKAIRVVRAFGDIDIRRMDLLRKLLAEHRPDAVLNAVGVIKQVIGVDLRVETIAINALYPNELSALCNAEGVRLVHYSTDCVFSGAEHSTRGPHGYRETDPPDARDLYGLSKLLGEPEGSLSVILRTSIIGPELRGRHGLLEWFLAQGAGPISGFTRALFTGLTTTELAHVTAMVLRDRPGMCGLWHVAAEPISKDALLRLAKTAYGRPTTVVPYPDFYCDRRLDGTRFATATGWRAPSWPALIEAMRKTDLNYHI